jgi:nucleoside-diphosphate-sugar epimerase
MSSTLIIGCGYLGRRLGVELIARGESVFGTTRSTAKADELRRQGIRPIIADVLEPRGAPWPGVERVVYAVGHERSTGVPIRRVYVEGLRAALERFGAPPRRLIYASSTGVYGQGDGSRVDERSPTEPRSESGRACLDAEAVIRSFAERTGTACTILRFAGLYGPGRLIGRAAIERGEPIEGDPDHILNLIHIDDAARFVVAAAIREGTPGDTYVVSDDRPVPRREFYGLVADCLDLPPPTFVPPPADRPKSARDASNKRVDSRLIKRVLNLRCHYPDIATGVPAALG